MKKIGLLLAILAGFLLLANSASAITFDATVTADNHYAIYAGNESGVSFIGRNEVGSSGNPGTYNWSLPESFSFDVDPGDYIYVAAWSDDRVAQGWIGQFLSGDSTILSNTSDWEVYLTFNDLDTGSPAPTEDELAAEISGASWASVSNYIDHGSGPWGYIDGISQDADWIWGSSLLGGSDYGEYQIFRTKIDPVPEPATIILSTLGLLGMGVVRKRKKTA